MDTLDNLVVEDVAYVDTDVNEIVHEQPLGQLNYKVYMLVVCDNFARSLTNCCPYPTNIRCWKCNWVICGMAQSTCHIQ